jgi:hypothetical protein
VTPGRADAPASAEPADTCRSALVQIRETNHAIGNALVGIMGYAELILMQLDAEESVFADRLRAMADAARRVDTLSQEISQVIQSALPRGE